jgi:citrate lyase subunit beta/citryl-CoA lyase
MAMRSWLFVPGDSETKLAKTAGTGADVVVIDLEDSVAPQFKNQARAQALNWLNAHRSQVLDSRNHGRWIRINAIGTPWWREDLVTVMQGAPEGIVLPKCEGAEQLQTLAAELYEVEQRNGIPTNTTRVLALAGETPASALAIATFANLTQPRLIGLGWGAEDLAAALGATRKRDSGGAWTDAFRLVRAQVLLAAHARGVLAIDAIYPEFKDMDALKKAAEAARADGFSGMLAVHPEQVPVINEAFTPSAEELAKARAIVDVFAANPGAGVVDFNGRMVDRPHLEQAKRLLQAAA